MLQDVTEITAEKDKKIREKYSTANLEFTKEMHYKLLQIPVQKL